jgi:hypothetical protein
MKVMLPAVLIAATLAIRPAGAQEEKKVPKDSVRVAIPGCSKDYIFTSGRPSEDQGATAVPEGTHLRMSGPKALMAEIKGHQGSRIEITGLIKKGQVVQGGVGIGGNVRISPGGGGPQAGSGMPAPGGNYIVIDVEGWRRIDGECPTR